MRVSPCRARPDYAVAGAAASTTALIAARLALASPRWSVIAYNETGEPYEVTAYINCVLP